MVRLTPLSCTVFLRLKLHPRYLHEVGDYEVSGRVVETGIEACEDKTSMLYARLVDTAGSRFFDLNRLSDCRIAWETALKIRKERLPHDSPFSKYAAPIFLVYVSKCQKSPVYRITLETSKSRLVTWPSPVNISKGPRRFGLPAETPLLPIWR